MTSAGARLTLSDVPIGRRFRLDDGHCGRRIDNINCSPFARLDDECAPRPIAPETPVAEILPVELEARDTAPVVDPLMRSA